MSNLPFRRDQIINIATNLALNIGIYEVTSAKVASLCKCSRAVIHYHIGTMDDLRAEIVRKAIEHGHKDILSEVVESGDPMSRIIPRGAL